MKSYALFQQYIWLVNIIKRYRKITFEEINHHWLNTDMSEGMPLARSTFNRHKDANIICIAIFLIAFDDKTKHI